MKFKQCRENAGLTQKETAISLGVSVQTVSCWETERKFPTLDNLVKLADLYHTTTDELLGRIPFEIKKEAPPEKPDGVEYVQIDLKKSSPAPDQRAALESLVREIVCQELGRRKPQS